MDLVKKGALKEFLKRNKMRTSNGLYEAANEAVEGMRKMACYRAGKGGRHTVMGWDV